MTTKLICTCGATVWSHPDKTKKGATEIVWRACDDCHNRRQGPAK